MTGIIVTFQPLEYSFAAECMPHMMKVQKQKAILVRHILQPYFNSYITFNISFFHKSLFKVNSLIIVIH